jgi:SAM-dependent methyltransferase
MNILARAWESLTQRGFKRSWETTLSVVEDWAFDVRYRTDTRRRLRVTELLAMGQGAPEASPYFPTRGRAFKRLLAHLHAPAGSTFVDLGSGKGKVLLLASRSFRRVVGVEFSATLCSVARANIQRYSTYAGFTPKIEIVCCDAGEYVFRPDVNVVFMFHPFGATVMRQVIDNLQRSLSEHPRPVWIVYTLPVFRQMLEERLRFHEGGSYKYGGFDFVILTNA